jgi:oligopeptide transport system substrate-binding protein
MCGSNPIEPLLSGSVVGRVLAALHTVTSTRRTQNQNTLIARMVWVCLVSGTLLIAGCTKQTPRSDDSQVLRISQRNEPSDLDPATATLPDEFFIIRALSEGLVTPAPLLEINNPSPAVLPGIAERWDVSDDGLTYTFHLRSNAFWSNGESVTATDFVESYQRLLTPSTGAPKAALFFMVKNARSFATGQLNDFSQVGFRIQDPRTLVITLEHPSPKFLLYVASGPWIAVNPRVVKTKGKVWTRPGNFVGNGPYLLSEWLPNQRIVVQRNPRYHNAVAAKLSEIQFIACDNGDTEDRAYRAGQLDVTMSVPYAKLPSYERERPKELFHAPLAESRYLSFNVRRAPLDDPRVRRALALAIDRSQLTDRILRGGHQPADRFLPPSLRDDPHTVPTIDHAHTRDVARAKVLLAEAGFPEGRGFPSLELTTWVNSPVIEAIQEMWKKELGIEVALSLREARVHIAALQAGNYDIGFITAIPDVPDAVNMLEDFISDAPGNYPHWSDEQFDQFIQQTKVSLDPDQRERSLRAAEDRLLEETPVTPLYFNARNWLMSSRVRGWQSDALWTRFYLHVELAPP